MFASVASHLRMDKILTVHSFISQISISVNTRAMVRCGDSPEFKHVVEHGTVDQAITFESHNLHKFSSHMYPHWRESLVNVSKLCLHFFHSPTFYAHHPLFVPAYASGASGSEVGKAALHSCTRRWRTDTW